MSSVLDVMECYLWVSGNPGCMCMCAKRYRIWVKIKREKLGVDWSLISLAFVLVDPALLALFQVDRSRPKSIAT